VVFIGISFQLVGLNGLVRRQLCHQERKLLGHVAADEVLLDVIGGAVGVGDYPGPSAMVFGQRLRLKFTDYA